MSVEQEQSQEYSLRAGLSMMLGPGAHKTNFDGEGKLNEQVSPTKESSSSAPVKNTQAAPGSSSPSNVKLVGSNRFVVFQYLIENVSIIHN